MREFTEMANGGQLFRTDSRSDWVATIVEARQAGAVVDIVTDGPGFGAKIYGPTTSSPKKTGARKTAKPKDADESDQAAVASAPSDETPEEALL